MMTLLLVLHFMVCFVLIAVYGYGWPLLSKAKSLHGVDTAGGH